ncbi:MAG: SRPBCC family protein [Gemmatimonadales bacterium]|jgi:ribosome-associated toxin RatA of RatAB toxin-antitoxin module
MTALVELGAMPTDVSMRVLDELVVRAPVGRIFALARDVERWPAHLPHYRYVRFNSRSADGGGIVEMSANRPFGVLDWPTWWRSDMQVIEDAPSVRYRHIAGITKGMDVEWTFEATPAGTHVRVLHLWNGPRWPLIGKMAATSIIGPVFVHGIASRTLAGLARVAEAA